MEEEDDDVARLFGDTPHYRNVVYPPDGTRDRTRRRRR
jgi:hypothetical protein